MTYYSDLPAYVYALPCGEVYRSLTPSVPLGPDGCTEADCGLHWFPCTRCRTVHEIRTEELRVSLPGLAQPTDYQLRRRIDAAIHCDRVAAYYRAVWDGASVRDVVRATGVCQRLVEKVAAELGVYGSDDSAVTMVDVSE